MTLLRLSQTITYWTIDGVDGNGEITYSTPKKTKARFARMEGIMTDDTGKQLKANYVAYSKVNIPKRSRVLFGSSSSATPVEDARTVLDVVENVSMTRLFKMVM